MGIQWRDTSFRMSFNPERWMPEAVVDTIQRGQWCSQKVSLSDNDSDRIMGGEFICSTRAEAKMVAYEMVRRIVWNEWRTPEENIREYESKQRNIEEVKNA